MSRLRLLASGLALAVPASVAGVHQASGAASEEWGPPHALRGSFYFGSDLGRDHDGDGGWLARTEVDGSGTTAVGYQVRRSDDEGPGRPAVAVQDTDGAWSRDVLADRDRTGYTWVGTDRRGRVTAVWATEDTDGRGHPSVHWARRNAAGVWGAHRLLRGVDARPTAFDVAPSGFGVLSFASGGAARVKVLTPSGTWRPRAQVSGRRLGEGVNAVAAVISNRGRVTAAFWSITVSNRTETSGPLQRGGLTAGGQRLPVVRLGHLDQSERFDVAGSPAGGAAVQVGDAHVAYRMPGDRWRRTTRPVTAVAVGGGGISVVALSATGVVPQQYSLSEYNRSTGAWSDPRVVATIGADEYAGGYPSALDLVRAGATTVLGFSLWHTDTTPVSYSTRVVTDVDGQATVEDLAGCFVDLDAAGARAAVLTTPACQPGGRLSVRTR